MLRREFIFLIGMLTGGVAVDAIADGIYLSKIIIPNDDPKTIEAAQVPSIDDLIIVKENYKEIPKEDFKFLLKYNGNSVFQKQDEYKSMGEEELKGRMKDLAGKFGSNLTTLICHKPDNNRFSAGSGFFITQDGFLLTNYHVIDDVVEKGSNLYALFFGVNKEQRFEKAKVLAYSKKRDIALCKVDNTYPDISPVPISNANLFNGQEAICFYLEYPEQIIDFQAKSVGIDEKIGVPSFPGLFIECHQDGTLKPKLKGYSISLGFGYVGDNSSQDLVIEHGILADGTRYEYAVRAAIKGVGGNSGSPVFDRNGNIIGIIALGDDKYNRVEMVHRGTIRDLLLQYQK